MAATMAVVFVVTLVGVTLLLTHHNEPRFIRAPLDIGEETWTINITTRVVPFGPGRVQYDVPLSMAPVVMMFMVPEPRFRSKYYWESYYPNYECLVVVSAGAYSGLSIAMFGLSVWSLYVLRDLHSVLNVSQSIFNLIFMAGVAAFTLFEFLRMVY
jgi:hypothetical protein